MIDRILPPRTERLPKAALPARLAALGTALLLAACGTPSSTGLSHRAVPGQLSDATPSGGSHAAPRTSAAATPRAYRADAARHVYELNASRIWSGKLPPLLYAIGTLSVDLDANGRVTAMKWMRAPQHAPEVIRQIEAMVLQASPFPVANRLGHVTWTDTWLVDRSGRFQLDTLSEGQL